MRAPYVPAALQQVVVLSVRGHHVAQLVRCVASRDERFPLAELLGLFPAFGFENHHAGNAGVSFEYADKLDLALVVEFPKVFDVALDYLFSDLVVRLAALDEHNVVPGIHR